MKEFILEFFRIIQYLLNGLLATYSVVVISTYALLAFISFLALRKYLKKNKYVDYNVILSSPIVPSVSIIAPAYNESRTIIENIRALLSIYYNQFEVIVVNDGSKDETLGKLIDAYELEKVNFAVDYKIPSQEIRGIYKSTNKSFEKLTVVDKVNGGKFDALNAGINISRKDLIVAIDVDSIIENDALLKLVKPFLEEKDRKVIATGGVIRIANSCKIEGGQIVEVRVPTNFWARIQVLEYTRAFLMGRMAWTKLDGLLLVSGALGMFDRDVLVKSGGYANTVGEDMELVVRMRRYMVENNMKYSVYYVPDPLCWTEAPSTLNVLGRQRNRWTRGNIDTLMIHKRIFFNPRYGAMGMLGYPYWFLFEWMAPVFEVIGIVYMILLALFGFISWPFFIFMTLFIYTFALAFSTFALLFEEISFHRYKKLSDIFKLMVTAYLEPIVFHPINVFWSIRGNIDYYLGKKSWGRMDRVGFGVNQEIYVAHEEDKEELKERRALGLVIAIAIGLGFVISILWFISSNSAKKNVENRPRQQKEVTATQNKSAQESTASYAEEQKRVQNIEKQSVSNAAIAIRKYHVIVGCFIERQKAEESLTQTKIRAHGAYLFQGADKRFYISLGEYSDRNEAAVATRSARSEFKDAWLFRE